MIVIINSINLLKIYSKKYKLFIILFYFGFNIVFVLEDFLKEFLRYIL